MGTYDPDNNFGYQYGPGLAAQYSHHAEDPVKAFYSGSMSPDQRLPTYQVTDWSKMDIVAIATLIYHQHDGPYRAASLTWYKITLHLGHIKTQLQQHGGELAKGWDPAKNEAASNFFHYVGASTWSMDEWITFALQNRDATLAVAGAISKARRDMAALWDRYQRDYLPHLVPPAGWDKSQPFVPKDGDGIPLNMAAIKKQFDLEAQGIIKELAGVYAGNWALLNEGHRFQGPTNAASPGKALEDRMPDIMANLKAGLPGGGKGLSGAANQKQLQAMQQQLDAQLAQQKQALEKALQEQAQQAELAKQALQQQQQQQLGQVPTFPPIQVGQPGPIGALPPGALPAFGLPPSVTGAGPAGAGFKGPTGLSNFNLTGDLAGRGGNPNGLLGRSGLPGMGGGMPGMPGGPGGRGMGNPGLRGRLGGPGQPGAPGNPGARSPFGGRRDDRDKDRASGSIRPESEEYLSNLPTGPGQMTGRLAGGGFEDSLTPPPGANLPGRPGIPGQRGGPGQPGFPGQPGVPGGGGRGRAVTPEDLAGRRQRALDAEINDDLMAPPLLLRPDLTGRRGMPAIDWDQVAPAEMGTERAMLGSRGAPPQSGPGMAERLARRRKETETEKARPEQERRSEDATGADELWTVATPETIEAPAEPKEHEQRGKALGAN
jgi:hypothetical protein